MPKTCSTPSALRHSMIESTARMERTSVPASAGLARGLGELQVRATAHADLVVERDHVAAFRALPQGLPPLPAPQDGRDRADHRQHRADGEPDEEGAALDLADHAGREAEADRDRD